MGGEGHRARTREVGPGCGRRAPVHAPHCPERAPRPAQLHCAALGRYVDMPWTGIQPSGGRLGHTEFSTVSVTVGSGGGRAVAKGTGHGQWRHRSACDCPHLRSGRTRWGPPVKGAFGQERISPSRANLAGAGAYHQGFCPHHGRGRPPARPPPPPVKGEGGTDGTTRCTAARPPGRPATQSCYWLSGTNRKQAPNLNLSPLIFAGIPGLIPTSPA
jgi:hypothetical protein